MNSINISLFRSINDLGFHLTFLNPVMVFIAEYGVYSLAIYMIFHWFFTKERIRTRIVLAGSIFAFLFSEVVGKVLGKFISHPQPFATLTKVNQLISHEIDNSFPSDHTILFSSICMMLFLGSKSSKRVFYLMAPAIVGFSRIWVGVHYPIDVLTATFIGILVSIGLYPAITRSKALARIIYAYNRLTDKSKKTDIDIN